MATTMLLFLAFGFIALSSSLPAEQNLQRQYSKDSAGLTADSRYDDNLINMHHPYGQREEGDFLIHRYTVNPIEIPTDKQFVYDIIYTLPEGYLWTYVDIFYGQLESAFAYTSLYNSFNRSILRMDYSPLCRCSVVRYEVFLYARKTN